MPLDSNGVWQYEETESAAPVAAMLNRLAGSVSDAIAPLVVAGSQSIPVDASGVTASSGYGLIVARFGPFVQIRGRLEGLTSGANVQINNTAVAEMFRPGVPVQDLSTMTNSSAATSIVRMWMTSAGFFNVRLEANTVVWINDTYLAAGVV
jgi:hypothetical protein